MTARELTICNALRKGLATLRQRPRAVVLAADTVVALGGNVLGKPADLPQAREFLRRLSGRTHQVYSSVVIANAKRQTIVCELSHVTFRRLSQSVITDYFRKVDPLDKAGGYAAQGHGTDIIARIDGSYTNVVGLPMERTLAALRRFGIVSASQPVPLPRFAPADGGRVARRGRETRR